MKKKVPSGPCALSVSRAPNEPDRLFRRPGMSSAVALALALAACSTSGSSFDTDSGMHPQPGDGTGGSDPFGGTGGTPSVDGTGGSIGPVGTGGDSGGPGTGGSNTTGSGGSNTGSGGRTSTGTGGSGMGGAPVGTGGRPGSGGSNVTPGTGGSAPIGTGGSAGPACPKPTGICHEFIANDNALHQINYVNEFEPAKGWKVSVGDGSTYPNSPRTIEIVNNPMSSNGKAVLVSLDKGYGEFDLGTGRNLVRKTLTAGSPNAGVSGAVRIPLPGGETYRGDTAIGTNAEIIIYNDAGSVLRRLALPTGPELRAIARHPTTGNFWFSKTQMIYEMSPGAVVLWSADMGAGTKGYSVLWRAGGGAYATTGEPATLVEIGPTKTQVSLPVGGQTKFPFLSFFSGFFRIPSNGNYVIANWLGHEDVPGPTTPHLIELTPQNNEVWRWGTQALARQITNVYILR